MKNQNNFIIDNFLIVDDFVLEIHYTDGKVQRVDFGAIKQRGDWKDLEDLDYFNKVFVNDRGNLEWPEGQDFKPEHLYYWELYQELYS